MDTILLVDDDPILQRIYASALPLGGFHHVPAASGEEACARAATTSPIAGAVIDLHLPGIDGLATIRRLRALPGLAEIPMLLFTIAPDATVRQQASLLPGVLVLDKSTVGPARMLSRLHEVLGHAAATPVAVPGSGPSRQLADLEARAARADGHGHRAVTMLRSACQALAGQLHLVDLRQHPGALGGLHSAVDLLEHALHAPVSALGSPQALAAIADDDRLARVLVSAALRKHGMAVAEFIDGEALLDGVRGSACDVVVTDLLMPRRSGIAVVNSLRHDHPGLPVIVVTALPPDRQAFAARHRPDEVVIKPFLLSELATKAWFHVVNHRLERVLPPPAPATDLWDLAT